MFIRDAFIASLLGIVAYTSTASANSCSNVNVIGSFDESGLRESEYGIYAAGHSELRAKRMKANNLRSTSLR